MRNRRESTLLGLALVGALVASACGGDAQSASDDESTRLAGEAPAAVPEPAYPTRSAEATPSTHAPPPRRAPARARAGSAPGHSPGSSRGDPS